LHVDNGERVWVFIRNRLAQELKRFFPLAAKVHCIPKAVSCDRRIWRLVALSSASSTRPLRRGFCFAGAAFPPARFSNLLVNQNVDPLPGSLSDSDLAVHHPYQLP
jgi:hypothetical protein